MRGRFVVISGPSGVGKGTICNMIMDDLDMWYSVSVTTRAPRDGEVDGVNYYFTDKDDFCDEWERSDDRCREDDRNDDGNGQGSE